MKVSLKHPGAHDNISVTQARNRTIFPLKRGDVSRTTLLFLRYAFWFVSSLILTVFWKIVPQML
jgi:hypothetical protein